jgi:hypothetical protein
MTRTKNQDKRQKWQFEESGCFFYVRLEIEHAVNNGQ